MQGDNLYPVTASNSSPSGSSPIQPHFTSRKRSLDMTDNTNVADGLSIQPQSHSQPLSPNRSAVPSMKSITSARPRSKQNQHPTPQQRRPSPPRAPALATAKVAIPRLNRDHENGALAGPSKEGEKHRVSHACEPCRSRKTKCTGERPICAHCKEYRLQCYYADGKRDRARKEFGNLQERVDEYEQLLKQLSIRGDSATQLAIQKALEKNPASPESDSNRMFSKSAQTSQPPSALREDFDDDANGEDLVGADVGSTGSLDRITQDFDRDEETTNAGYFGKTSDVAWIERVRKETLTKDDSGTDTSPMTEQAAASSTSRMQDAASDGRQLGVSSLGKGRDHRPSTYHLEGSNLKIPGQLDEYALPLKPVTDVLVDAYFNTIHSSFPLISKSRFLDMYDQCFAAYVIPLSRRRRAMLNLVFAIGAKYSVLNRAGWCDDRDHLLFFSRARSLSLDNGALWEVGDLEQVQVMGLGVLYLTMANHVNRAWYMSGLAIRYAQVLGLHLRNDSKHQQMSDIGKEQQVRVWWSLYSLEGLLGIMTGRPSAINDREICTSMPVAVDEEAFAGYESGSRRLYEDYPVSPRRRSLRGSVSDRQSETSSQHSQPLSTPPLIPTALSVKSPSTNPSRPTTVSTSPLASPTPQASTAAFFINRVKLSIINHQIAFDLYNVENMHSSWGVTQKSIEMYTHKLERWQTELPPAFDFRQSHHDQTFARERLGLGLLYWSTLIVLYRPCLCKMEGQIPNESDASRVFNRVTAGNCVHAASEMLRLIPDEPNPAALYSIAPSWSLLHHLSQATSVIMLELAFAANHVPQDSKKIFLEAKKAVNWLRAMAMDSVAADRAWHLMDGLLRRVAPKIGADVADMPDFSPRTDQSPPDGSLAGEVAQAEAFDLWQQDQDQYSIFRDFDATLSAPLLYGSNSVYPEPPAYPAYSGFNQAEQPTTQMDHSPSYPILSSSTDAQIPVSATPSDPNSMDVSWDNTRVPG